MPFRNVGYMSPEQAEAVAVSSAADLFGLATVLYGGGRTAAVQGEEPDVLKSLLTQDEATRRAAKCRKYDLARVWCVHSNVTTVARFESALAMGRAVWSDSDPISAQRVSRTFRSR